MWQYPSSFSSSPQKDLIQAKNGFSSVQDIQLQTTQFVKGATGSSVKSESPSTSSIPSLNETVPAASLLMTANQHSSSLSCLSHSEEIPNTTTTQHSSALSTRQNTLSSSTSSEPTSTCTLLHTSVESKVNRHSSSSTFSTTSSTVSTPPPVFSVSSSLNSGSSLGLSLGSNSTVTASTQSSVAITSGKVPPNLPPGVPPLLPNPYNIAPCYMHTHHKYMVMMIYRCSRQDFQWITTVSCFPYPPLHLLGGMVAWPVTLTLVTSPSSALGMLPPSHNLCPTPEEPDAESPYHAADTPKAPPPGYSYTSPPYYTGVPGLPSTFQYGSFVFPMAPTSSKQHSVNVSVNASTTPFQQPSGYGSPGYNRWCISHLQ